MPQVRAFLLGVIGLLAGGLLFRSLWSWFVVTGLGTRELSTG